MPPPPLEIEIEYWQHFHIGNISPSATRSHFQGTHPTGRFRSADRRQSGFLSQSYHINLYAYIIPNILEITYYRFHHRRSFSHPSFPSSEIYLWLKSRRKSTDTWLLYRRIHSPSWLFYRPTTIIGTNIIISVLISAGVATMNDLRRFAPICGHSISKTKLAG